jgi:hypothetical protein
MEDINWFLWWCFIIVSIAATITNFVTKEGTPLNRIAWIVAWTTLAGGWLYLFGKILTM